MSKGDSHRIKTATVKKSKFQRYLWIDSLRGLACLIVMVAHIVAVDPVYGIYANGCGKIGVWLFMLLSGFLFGKSSFLQQKRSITIHSVLKFYEKKALRLYPEYLMAIMLAVILGLFDIHTVKDILLFRSTWGHFWYMSVIIQFYLIAPCFALLRRIIVKVPVEGKNAYIQSTHNKRRWLYCCALLIIAILVLFLFPATTYTENSTELWWYLPIFLMGIVLAEVSAMHDIKSEWFDILPIIGLLGIVILTPLGRQLLFGYEPSRYLQNKYLVIGLLWILIMLGAIYGKQTGRILDQAKPLQAISVYSYVLYLFHYIILQWVCGYYGKRISCLQGISTIVIAGVLAFIIKWIRDIMKRNIDKHERFGFVIAAIAILLIVG